MTRNETCKGRVLLDEIVAPTRPWAGLVRAGQTLRIEDSGGCQAVDTLFYAAADTTERYSSQETLLDRAPPIFRPEPR